MNFIEVVKLQQLDKNTRIKRRDYTCTYRADLLNTVIINDKFEVFTPTIDDILAEDWYVVKDEKLHTFEEAIVAFKNGKTIKRKATQTHYNTDRWPPEMALISTQDLIANDWLIIN